MYILCICAGSSACKRYKTRLEGVVHILRYMAGIKQGTFDKSHLTCILLSLLGGIWSDLSVTLGICISASPLGPVFTSVFLITAVLSDIMDWVISTLISPLSLGGMLLISLSPSCISLVITSDILLSLSLFLMDMSVWIGISVELSRPGEGWDPVLPSGECLSASAAVGSLYRRVFWNGKGWR
jgi:hypothetical protein